MVKHFPNPHTGIIIITFADNGSNEVSIINITGRILNSERTKGTSYIDRMLCSKPAGIYIIYVRDLNKNTGLYLRSIKL